MSTLNNLILDLALEAAHRKLTAHTFGDSSTIDRLAAKSGLPICGWCGGAAVFHFSDPIVGNRKIYVAQVENGMGVFTSPSLMVLDSVPRSLLEYLAARSALFVLGTWTTHVVKGGTLILLANRTILDTMSAVRFRHLYEEMAREAQYLDGQLQKAGIGA